MTTDSPLYIVTGTTGSIGAEIARSIAAEGKSLVLACRNMSRAEVQRAELIRTTGNNDIHCVCLELDSFKGVTEFCDEIGKMRRRVAALVNNAGVMSRKSVSTACGYEQDFQVNTLSTALLSLKLLPFMDVGSSIVFTTSVTRNVWRLSDKFPEEPSFGQLSTYGRSKRALTMFAVSLAEKMKERGIRVNCADPGVVDTGMIAMGRWFDPLADIFFRPFISSPTKGASSAIFAMKSEKTGNIYYHDKEIKPSTSIVKDAGKIYGIIEKILSPYL